MKSNITYNKVCEFCGKNFVARRRSSATCSDYCAKRAYKKRKSQEVVDIVNTETKVQKFEINIPQLAEEVFLTPTQAASLLGVNRSTIYRYIGNCELKAIKLGGRTLIRRKDIDNLFEKEDISKPRPSVSKAPITDFYLISEIAKKYNCKKDTIYRIINLNKIPKLLRYGKTYISKQHIDSYFEKNRTTEFDPDKYYSVADIMEKYNMTKSAIYSFVHTYNIPIQKNGRSSLYSKIEFDKVKNKQAVQYYTVMEVAENYNISTNTVYHIVKNHKITKIQEGRHIKLVKQEIDKFFDNKV